MAKQEKGSGHDQMVVDRQDPYYSKASDFPVAHADSFTKQSGSAGSSSGHNELAEYSENQCGPRHIEDGGDGSPTDWQSGGRSARVAAAFPIVIGKGEGSSAPSSMSISESVNLSSGLIEGGSPLTRVKEVPESKVHIPSGR